MDGLCKTFTIPGPGDLGISILLIEKTGEGLVVTLVDEDAKVYVILFTALVSGGLENMGFLFSNGKSCLVTFLSGFIPVVAMVVFCWFRRGDVTVVVVGGPPQTPILAGRVASRTLLLDCDLDPDLPEDRELVETTEEETVELAVEVVGTEVSMVKYMDSFCGGCLLVILGINSVNSLSGSETSAIISAWACLVASGGPL